MKEMMKNHGPNWYDNWIKKYKIDPLNIPVKENVKIAAIGDVHEQSNLFYELISSVLTNDQVDIDSIKFLFVGDFFDKGQGASHAENMLDYCLRAERDNIEVLKGNHEIKKIKHYRRINSPLEKVLSDLPNALSFVWPNGFRLTCVHAGVTPRHTWNDLKYNSEICYVRSVNKDGEMIPLIWIEKNGEKVLEPKESDGKSWHELYDGRFGYIASGHDQQNDAIPKFYQHSCNVDSAAYQTGVLTAAIFGQNGFEKVIQTKRT